jgi:serine/threonine-protein phosphatase 2B catalytic subunit
LEPVVVVGDIHGQLYDLVHMINKIGDPSTINYLFLGDYVDRGIFSTETIILLLAMKVAHPNRVFLLRGNHESRGMTEYFTFREEVLDKFDLEVYDILNQAFDTMPLVAVVNEEYLCMHGGVSPNMKSISEINKVNRFEEVPLEGLLCDILWSDPVDDEFADKIDFIENADRNCGFKYGLAPTKKHLDENDLTLVIRAHQV